jgi:hypothetical protein
MRGVAILQVKTVNVIVPSVTILLGHPTWKTRDLESINKKMTTWLPNTSLPSQLQWFKLRLETFIRMI